MGSAWLLAWRPFKLLLNSNKVGRVIAWILLPIWLLWSTVSFFSIWRSLALCVYILYPVSLSRLAVFIHTILFIMFGLSITICGIIFMADAETRPMYAVTWETSILAPNGKPCSCGCNYHIGLGSSFQFTCIGASAIFQAFIIGSRCLKGLRRSNWANLLTVMFQVPVNIY